jgi:phospholipase C
MSTTTRRGLLQGMGAVAGGGLVGCAAESGEVASQEDELISCLWNGRAKKALMPRGVFGPIEHIVVLMMENRSFDHVFGALSIEPGRTDVDGNDMGGEGRADVNGLSGDEYNLDLDGNKIHVRRQMVLNKASGLWEPNYVLGDISHEWDACHNQFDWTKSGTGKNDGFVREHHTDLKKGEGAYCKTAKYFGNLAPCQRLTDPMSYYTREDLPVSYALADNYTICDNWYSSVLGPTWPNRFYLNAASSGGQQGNSVRFGDTTLGNGEVELTLALTSIWDVMEAQCLKRETFFCDIPWSYAVGESRWLDVQVGDGQFGSVLEAFWGTSYCTGAVPDWVPSMGTAAAAWQCLDVLDWRGFLGRVKADALPHFSVIDPGYKSGYDDHPPSNVRLGQAFISYLYHALASNPKVWAKTLLIITYDEHGSFYDHVVPPGNVPGSPQSFDKYAPFRQLGIRVPAIVIGPHVKKGYVSHAQYDHVSVLSTLYDRFNLATNGVGWINERLRRTNTLADCIDQNVAKKVAAGGQAPLPAVLPKLELSESEIMDGAAYAVPGHEEMVQAVARSPRPELDLTPFRKQHLAMMLEQGEELGAFKITR